VNAAIATNMALDLLALYAFICGRGAQEKTLAELKGEFALDVIRPRYYSNNSAWRQLSVLAHNLIRSFQLDMLARGEITLCLLERRPAPSPRMRGFERRRRPEHGEVGEAAADDLQAHR